MKSSWIKFDDDRNNEDDNNLEDKSEDVNHAVLLTTFIVKRKRCRVYFHNKTLIWETIKSPVSRWTLPLSDVISVRYGSEWSKNGESVNEVMTTLGPVRSFVLHYAARGSKNKWSHHHVTMRNDDERQVTIWVKTLRDCLSKLTHRPRSILLFVNPFGGKRRGLKILDKHVKPLMDIAEVDMKVIITERAGHIREILSTADLDSVQAVGCIGGDGTFAEVFNGLIIRKAKDLKLDLNDPNVKLPKPTIPVAVIPAGSTDTVVYSLHGTIDVETAILNVIFGDTVGLDLSTVHSDHCLLRIYASVLSYGYLGDVVKESEKFRWMGPHRYNYTGFKKIIGNKGYEGEVMLLSDSCQPATCSKCFKNCARCKQRSKSKQAIISDDISRWLTVKGKFFMVNGANLSCACEKSPMGFSPHCHIGDGCVDIILVRHTSFINNIRMLWRITSKNKNLYDLPFVEVYRAREFTFRAVSNLLLNSEKESTEGTSQLNNSCLSVWNCDGEVISAPSVKIRVHCQIIKVFTRRMQTPAAMESSCFCLL